MPAGFQVSSQKRGAGSEPHLAHPARLPAHPPATLHPCPPARSLPKFLYAHERTLRMNFVAASPLLATSTEWMGLSPPQAATQASSWAATSAGRLGTPGRVVELQVRNQEGGEGGGRREVRRGGLMARLRAGEEP